MASQELVNGAPWPEWDELRASSLRMDSGGIYGLIDAAQDKAAWLRLKKACAESRPLLGADGDVTAEFSPHLVLLEDARGPIPQVRAVLDLNRSPNSLSFLVSPLSIDVLHRHLSSFLDVRLTEGLDMVLAFWDPAILGTLVGQSDDDSLHVRGPVLTEGQRKVLLAPIVQWWYTDRMARWHVIRGEGKLTRQAWLRRLEISQEQEDDLIEASVPDQILYHLEVNQPLLFDRSRTHVKRYNFVKAVLKPARELGLEGLRDLVNFTALCLIYKQRIKLDPEIVRLLTLVRLRELTLDEAMSQMPE